jgi:carbon monoxide dehydrogenase subunit G
MSIQTRYAGDANGINNVDGSYTGTLGSLIATGLTKNPIAIKILLGGAQTFATTDLATGGPVETILRALEIDGTVTMYQVDTSQLSVLLEASGAGGSVGTSTSEGAVILTTSQIATALQTRVQALTANLSTALGTGNVWANVATVTSSGFKLA